MPRSRIRAGTGKAAARKGTVPKPGRVSVQAVQLHGAERAGSQALPQRREAAADTAKPEGWKAAVHRYVKLYNQAEIDRYAAPFEEVIIDGDHLFRFTQRLDRLREQELLRGVLPSRSETSAELLRISESGSLSEVCVLIELRIKRTIDQQGRTYLEERCDRERLWLAADGDAYSITRVEPIVSERRPRFSSSQSSHASEFADEQLLAAESKPQSIPYINYDVLPFFKHGRAGIRYRRDLAAAYADRWWNEANPAYENFEVNCTNYISQCLFAGNGPMNYTGKRASGWWYRGFSGGRENWSYSWAVANALQHYLSAPHNSSLRATVVQSADQLALGDVIIYDWGGDGRFQHSTIVTAFDAAGMPLVNANTVPSRHRYWDYQDSYAWTENTKYRFFHIADEF
ncbi:amidase domain-containing protein [Paenibacillus sp. R14(2021)]|uniref:amidase domain-containing protein n=1 Tax=Paenibacillus sp. R14(2021) TaxID=2859228 RepID=UPI002157E08C|nr:amidase domain-containing protein [Paenibacillus sp. R14(2021)]